MNSRKKTIFRRAFWAAAALGVICAGSVPAAFAQPCNPATAPPGGTLDPCAIPKYVQPLVIPPVMKDTGMANDYDIAVRQFQQQILPGGHWNAVAPACIANPALCNLPATTVWSYGPAADPLPDSSGIPGGAPGLAPALNSQFNYPAFTVENTAFQTTMVNWINDLKDPVTGNYLPHLLPIDRSLHWANPELLPCSNGTTSTDCRPDPLLNGALLQQPYLGPVPIVTHVHGAHVGPESDGYPEAWWLPAATNIPAGYATTGTLVNQYGVTTNTPGVGSFSYPNDQPSTTLWYHDHTLGMTRNNVYAGPAGFWLIRETGGGETGLVSGTLPGPAPVAGEDPNFVPADRSKVREIPIVIQDRSFNADGSLFYPDNRAFFEGTDSQQAQDSLCRRRQESVGHRRDLEPGSFLQRHGGERGVLALIGCGAGSLSLPVVERLQLAFPQPGNVRGQPGRDLGCGGTVLPDRRRAKPVAQRGQGRNGLSDRATGWRSHPPGAVPAAAPEVALLMGLAERADVLVDFSGLAPGTQVRMINTAPDAPFGGFPDIPADPGTTGQVMEFVVAAETPAGEGFTAPEDLVLNLPDAGDPANGPVIRRCA